MDDHGRAGPWRNPQERCVRGAVLPSRDNGPHSNFDLCFERRARPMSDVPEDCAMPVVQCWVGVRLNPRCVP